MPPLFYINRSCICQLPFRATVTWSKVVAQSQYKKLTPSELLKPGREGRGPTLIKKIEEGQDFVLFSGEVVKFKKDAAVLGAIAQGLKQGSNDLLNAIRLTSTTNKQYKISDLAKTAEFGGKGAGSGTVAESIALTDIQAKLQALLVKENKPFIKVDINGKVVQCSNFQKTDGTPKSDFHILDPKGKEVAWISHKKGTRAKDFQQYGGMIELSPSEELDIFVKDVKNILSSNGSPNVLPMKTAYYRKVKDKRTRMKTLFGKDFKTAGPDSRQNIDVLYQGVLDFKKGTGDVYTITSSHTVFHGKEPTGDYEPYYYIRPEQAKTQFGVRGGRFFIVAKLTAISNKNATEI